MSVRIQLPAQFPSEQAGVPRPIQCPQSGCDGRIEAAIHGQIVAIWAGHGPRIDALR